MKTKLTKAELDELLPHIRRVLETGIPRSTLWKRLGRDLPAARALAK